MTRRIRRTGINVALVVFLAWGCSPPASPPVPAQVRLAGRSWTVELALTRAKRQAGLSGRTALPAGRGMLFVYPKPQKLSFCMRGCDVPIDIAFLDSALRVVNLYEMQVEPDRAGRVIYRSHVPARYALEVAGGTLRRAGVRIGQQAECLGVPDPAAAEPDENATGRLK